MSIRTHAAMAAMLLLLCSGCAVRAYQVQQERVDQDLTAGNRGRVIGEVPRDDIKDRRTTRTIPVIELELPGRAKPATQAPAAETAAVVPAPTITVIKQYTVKANDTLQKISREFYGTINAWTRIYDANRDILTSPDSIYPGQTLKIPVTEQKK